MKNPVTFRVSFTEITVAAYLIHAEFGFQRLKKFGTMIVFKSQTIALYEYISIIFPVYQQIDSIYCRQEVQ